MSDSCYRAACALLLLSQQTCALRTLVSADDLYPVGDLPLESSEVTHQLVRTRSATPDLYGAWVEKHWLHDLHYDVLRTKDGSYEGFPISGCKEGHWSLSGIRCSSIVALHVTEHEDRHLVVKVRQEHGTTSTDNRILTVVRCGDERINGRLNVVKYHARRPYYQLEGVNNIYIHWNATRLTWTIELHDTTFGLGRHILYESTDNSLTLPLTNWKIVDGKGRAPPPEITAEDNTSEPDVQELQVTAMVNDSEVNKLTWSDGSVWMRYTGPPNPLDSWDEECRALVSPGTHQTAIRYSMSVATAAGLSWQGIPGVSVDVIHCLDNAWLSAHQQQLKCILDMASGNGSSAKAKSMVKSALKKVKSCLPLKESATCVPSVCLGTGFPVLPPSLIPSVYFFLAWPRDLDSCNGLHLHEEIDKARVEEEAEELEKLQTPQGPVMGHGIGIMVYPFPSISYLISGVIPISIGKLFKKTNVFKLPWEDVRGQKDRALNQLNSAIQDAFLACPSVRRRFELHSDDVRQEALQMMNDSSADMAGASCTRATGGTCFVFSCGSSRNAICENGECLCKEGVCALNGACPEGALLGKSALEHLRLTAARFPELAGRKSIKTTLSVQPGVIVGGFSLIGTGAIVVGIFGGAPSLVGRTLGSAYMGCPQWKKVIHIWNSNPVLELESAQEEFLHDQASE